MPQGGVDENESFITAMKRELFEETGIKNIEIIKQLKKMYQYNLPENLVGIIWKVNTVDKNRNGLLQNLKVMTVK